ncbi:hypothetical protein ELS24_20925 [Achromobacter spanius]|uniref:hypothetical protein n=1 Tax=Achromobacter spanius TaxID=217203 RepID=UPI000F8FA4A1|nr:hypothetical protein [Achromobacter spanius]AZS80695.1 hypothetical protein ELS24_20925 [Achromobacter spanius]
MKTTLKLSHEQYREFADLCKVEAGQGLEVSTFAEMHNSWGLSGGMAWELISDVRTNEVSFDHHVGRITLAESIDVADFRRAGRSRPELDWSVLSDEEIYPFVVWHEIGHRRDNFNMLDAALFDREGFGALCYINEVLADRFAWSRIRPGESLPMTRVGKTDQAHIAEQLDRISKRHVRARYAVRPLAAGQYVNISPRMLESRHLAAYLGPDVHPELLAHYIWKRANRLDYSTPAPVPKAAARAHARAVLNPRAVEGAA